jgi:hypothetical protein
MMNKKTTNSASSLMNSGLIAHDFQAVEVLNEFSAANRWDAEVVELPNVRCY